MTAHADLCSRIRTFVGGCRPLQPGPDLLGPDPDNICLLHFKPSCSHNCHLLLDCCHFTIHYSLCPCAEPLTTCLMSLTFSRLASSEPTVGSSLPSSTSMISCHPNQFFQLMTFTGKFVIFCTSSKLRKNQGAERWKDFYLGYSFILRILQSRSKV